MPAKHICEAASGKFTIQLGDNLTGIFGAVFSGERSLFPIDGCFSSWTALMGNVTADWLTDTPALEEVDVMKNVAVNKETKKGRRDHLWW
jgi:hypothetical protein